MKTLFALLLAALALATLAQPQKINYQAIALGSNGKPLKNTAVSLRLSILDSAANGTVLYTETQPATTDAGGQFSVYLGTGTPTAGTFAGLPWANGNDKFLKVEMDAQGGTSYQTMGTTQLVSVPYAMASKIAQVAKELEIGTIVRGNNGEAYSLTIGPNGPIWTCYPPAIQANAGADQLNVCSNTVTLSGNTASGMTPAWSILTGAGGSVNGNTLTGIRGNAYSLRYTLSNACGTTSDTLQISLALPATTASAGPDQLSLTGTTATLAANAPAAGQTGTWTITTGSGATLSNANSPTATFTKGTDSSYTLVWTITGPCGSSRDTVNLLFPAPVGTACGQAVSYAGESYPTVQIGTQCWFAKNLNVGTMINSTASVDSQRNNGVIEKYCYNNDPANCTTYGGLYQWAEAVQYQNGASNTTSPNPAFTGNVRGICPTGWHLPSDAEYCTLTTFLDATVNCTVFNWSGTDVGGKMKSTSGLWTSPNNGATNSSGFSALPGGYRDIDGTFGFIGYNALFWSSSESSSPTAVTRPLFYNLSNIRRNSNNKNGGFSARCIMDNCTTTTSSAGPDQLSLTGTTATLAANAPAAGETGTWTITTGSGATFSNANDPAATFTKGNDSAYTLVWTITGPCGSSRDTVNLRFPAPVGTACGQTISYAGESYPTVQIGTQCWFAKNLNVGTMIQGANDQTNNSVLEKYCYNNNTANCTTYGGLYQWAEAVQYQNGASNSTSPSPAFTGNVRGICPTGWHLPSDAEYCTLTTFLDASANCNVFGTSSTTAGGALKSTSGLWISPNTGATNSSGFSALPGGDRYGSGAFYDIGNVTSFWSSSESSTTGAVGRYLGYNLSVIFRSDLNKYGGFSARCTQD